MTLQIMSGIEGCFEVTGVIGNIGEFEADRVSQHIMLSKLFFMPFFPDEQILKINTNKFPSQTLLRGTQ